MNKRNHLLLLLLWLTLGAALRFLRLAFLPPWTDECATIAFSLGNSFNSVPLNQVISANVLLQPLYPNSTAGIESVVNSLFGESTHPPVYFILSHLWMKLFSPPPELASIWVGRSLSAVLGVISIPIMFAVGCFAFRSPLVGQFAAAMMAISPYVIFLGREARHYTFILLLVIASLACFIQAIRHIHHRQSLPRWVAFVWVIINSLGVATHYFFVLSLAAQGLVFLGLIWQQLRKNKSVLVQPDWRIIWVVALGTLIGCLVWLPALQNIYGSEPTTWVSDGEPSLAPIVRLLLWIMSMLLLLPSAFTTLPIAIVVISGVITLLFLLWAIPNLLSGMQIQQQYADTRLVIPYLTYYVLGAIALFMFFTYILGMDLTLAARFQFVIAPAVILIIAAALAGCWQGVNENRQSSSKSFPLGNKLLTKVKMAPQITVSIICFMAFLGGITVVWNWGYLQNHRPDILAPIIQNQSQAPVVIATTHKHHGQTGRMMGLAWEKRNFPTSSTVSPDWQFFLAHRNPLTKNYTHAVEILQAQLSQLPKPLDLWLVDFRAPLDLASQNCFPEQKSRQSAGEYRYQLYHCRSGSNK
ncbi:MAG: glycosyltransferase family 39 protein [Calothrix sp. MO_192.B10]|nr:glycosyltransferase family 39 protein [Calothrix sp. MO_192.B10]